MTTPEVYLHTQPESFLAFAPYGPGLLCAMVYFVSDKDVYGWWTGFKDYRYPSAFFKLENFFDVSETACFATEGSDIYGGWRYDYARSEPKLDRPVPVEDEYAHKLDQLEDAFAAEWLFFRDDKDAHAELDAYTKGELPVQEVNVQHRRLNKLDKTEAVWTFRSHAFNARILEYLTARWPLDYGKE